MRYFVITRVCILKQMQRRKEGGPATIVAKHSRRRKNAATTSKSMLQVVAIASMKEVRKMVLVGGVLKTPGEVRAHK
jgi:hypothetical protein